MELKIDNLIKKKQNGKVLSQAELKFFVNGVCKNNFDEKQIIEMLKAIFKNGMTFLETYYLTLFMSNSGETVDLKSKIGEYADKHSTGGVSDTTTIVVVPLLASLDIKVAKMSGRSLGFTGGTADKMEVFKGYKTNLTTEEFADVVKKTNASIITQSKDFVPADKILYALRNKSNTVESIPLIASSIMSKKLGCGATTILLDVKFGSGAFMKTKSTAIKLAKLMVKIGKKAGRKTCAVLSDMNQPLTKFIGNNFEVLSAIEVLKGKENRLSKLSVFLASKIILMEGKAKTFADAKKMAEENLKNEKALNKLREIVVEQGGSDEIIENLGSLKQAKNKYEIKSEKSGYITKLNCEMLGKSSHLMCVKNGKFSRQDEVGIILNCKIGEKIQKNQVLATLFYNDCDNIDIVKNNVLSSFKLKYLTKTELKKLRNKKLVYRTICWWENLFAKMKKKPLNLQKKLQKF